VAATIWDLLKTVNSLLIWSRRSPATVVTDGAQ
jgi:hypothetical protein